MGTASRKRGILAALLGAGLLLAGCASITPPGPGTALIVGQVKLDASGAGQANNGADGLINATYPSGTVMTVQNVTTGNEQDIVTLPPGNLFLVQNAEPGHYRVTRLWCQVETANAWVTLASSVSKGAEFDVSAGEVVNLGTVLWLVGFDLSASRATASFTQPVDGFSNVARAVARMSSAQGWQSQPVSQTGVSAVTESRTTAIALQPKGYHPFPWIF